MQRLFDMDPAGATPSATSSSSSVAAARDPTAAPSSSSPLFPSSPSSSLPSSTGGQRIEASSGTGTQCTTITSPPATSGPALAPKATATSAFEAVFRHSPFFSSVVNFFAPSSPTSPTASGAATHGPTTTVITTTRSSFADAGGFVSGGGDRTAGTSASGAATTATTLMAHVNVSGNSGAVVPWKTTALAAATESFYRSALNCKINQALTGVRGPLFPKMHVQLPTRVVYITGFKSVRIFVESNFRPESFPGYETPVRIMSAVAPGIVMTPVSSILEACNANLNKQPLYRRWLNGIVARSGREIIFGIGLNQLSDHFQEQMPEDLAPAMRNAGGCLTAGVIAGYLSHVPHNISTMKLMNPRQSYLSLLQQFSRQWHGRLGFLGKGPLRDAGAVAMSLILPQGLFVRTVQVVGSFIILNGIIHSCRDKLGEGTR